MAQKSVPNLIIENFISRVREDSRFSSVARGLAALMDKEKRSERELEKALRGKQDEDPESGS